MPTIGTTSGEVNALENIADQVAELVSAKKARETPGWTFTIHRDKDGDIATVTCEPNGAR